MYVSAFLAAIDAELRAIRADGGSRIELGKRKHLGQDSSGTHYYQFRARTEVGPPDDSPIEVETGQARVSGCLVRTDGFNVVVALQAELPTSVDGSDTLITDPTFILAQLRVRLEQVLNPSSRVRYNTDLALQLLQSSGPEDPDLLVPESYTKGLNAEQSSALQKALTRDLTFIWGPPGTGKTFTLANIIAAFLDQGKDVLLLAHSNVAVDTVMLRIARLPEVQTLIEGGKIVRTGYPRLEALKQMDTILGQRIAEQLLPPEFALERESIERNIKNLESKMQNGLATPRDRDSLSKLLAKRQELRRRISEVERCVLQQARLVGTTLSRSAVMDVLSERSYDVVVIDEASMAYIPHVFWAACLSSQKLIVAGDFRQLGPVVKTEQERARHWLARDAFEVAGLVTNNGVRLDDPRMAALRVQHRMHPLISRLVDRIYSGRLRDAEGTSLDPDGVITARPFPGNVVTLIDTAGLPSGSHRVERTNSRYNRSSAELAIQLAAEALASNVVDVGIVTPFVAQAQLIQQRLEEKGLAGITVSTVHRLQGSEKSLVIIDLVESYPQQFASKLIRGGINSTAMRLINVAITRAKKKVILLADRRFMKNKLNNSDVLFEILELIASQYGVHDPETRTILKTKSYTHRATAGAVSHDLDTPSASVKSHPMAPTLQDLETQCPRCGQSGGQLGLSRYNTLYVPCRACGEFRSAALDDLVVFIQQHHLQCPECHTQLWPVDDGYKAQFAGHLQCGQCGRQFRWESYLRARRRRQA